MQQMQGQHFVFYFHWARKTCEYRCTGSTITINIVYFANSCMSNNQKKVFTLCCDSARYTVGFKKR